MPKCPPTGSVRLQEVSVSGGSTVFYFTNLLDVKYKIYNLKENQMVCINCSNLNVQTFLSLNITLRGS